MKPKLLTICIFLIATTTSPHAADRPSIGGLQQKVDALVAALLVCPSTSPQRFVDNGDGTICDHKTGLMWEKKDAEDGTEDLIKNPHDVDNTYTKAFGAGGSVVTDFLARLNGEKANGVGSPPNYPEQLGGYSDWRLPTLAELLTIRCEPPGSAIPCIIDRHFEPTAAAFYWTSTFSVSGRVFMISFDDGDVNSQDITTSNFARRVRAVRGGR